MSGIMMQLLGTAGGQNANNYLVTVQKSGGVVDVLDHTTPGSLSSNDTIAIGGSGNDGYSAVWASDDSFIVACSEGNPHLHLIDSSNYGNLSSTDTFNTTFRSRALALSPGDDQVAVGHVDGSGNWRLFQISSGSLSLAAAEVVPNGDTHGSVTSIDYSPDGTYIAVLARPSYGNTFLHLYSVPTNNSGAPSFIASYDANVSGGNFTGTVRFSPNGTYIAVIFTNKIRVFTYNSSSLTLLATQSIVGSGIFHHIGWNPDNSEIAALASGNKRLHLYQFDPTNGSEEDRIQDGDSTYTLPGTPKSLAWTSDGKYIAVRNSAGLELINAGDHTNLTQADRLADSSYNSDGDRFDWSHN